ncbi:putative Zn-dependent protease [Rhodoferax saidenbachensis]|uniref:Zn-dependent protease n=1 Tax=Rhodoferax saidenbachensis TaxID=1484693 RepID=A0ABU1ZNU5_9BURK|nr:putative Zn-dependent protease [Rhodoferax saidenbachensis]
MLPNLGDTTSITPSAERRLGNRIARELYRDPDYLDDPVIMEYVQGIWQPLLAAARTRGELPPELDEQYAWTILLGRDRTVNAFALPGAYLGLHLGLVGVVTSRDELAAVLAHELSHVTQRHIARLISRQSEQTPWLIGAMILGALAASKNPGAANAVIVGGQAAAIQTQLNFSRDMEREADRVGFGVASQAGFAPQGFVSMFEKLQQSNRLNDSGGFPYLRSHPLTTERMADMQARVPANGAAAPVPQWEHALIAARARVLSNPAVDALRNWYSEAEPARLAQQSSMQQAATLYGATLAATKLRDFALADASLGRLAIAAKGDPLAARQVRLLAAELALAKGDGPKALAALGESMQVGSRAELLLQAQAQLQAGRAAQAGQLLQTWLADNPLDALAWQTLASASAAQGKTLAAIRAEAEVNIAELDYTAALARLKAAQDRARSGTQGADHFEASIVDTRTRQVEQLLKEQALER